MTLPLGQPELLHSTLAEDPDLGEIVRMFVDEMPDRVQALLDHLKAGDWKGLGRLAHQLKGAAGSHGFDPITPAAAAVEQAVRDHEPEALVRREMEALVDLCRRVRAPGQG